MRTEGDIAIAGAGYVGLTSAACFCEMGHGVRLVEVDPVRLALLRAGTCPIFEQGLPEMLRRHLGDRLQLTDRLADAVAGARALFVCVGTPPKPGGAPDLRALQGLANDLAQLDLGETVVVLKSTVPPGTNRMVYEALGSRTPVVSNPEFLREGTAVHDFFHPDRVVVGSPDAEAALAVASLYAGVDAPLLVTGWEEAELIKYATNAFLAIKISFAGEIAALCEALGAEAPDVLKGLGLDHRVGSQFLRPGPGYGGSCLPKDIRALAWRARQAGVKLDLLQAAERANARVRTRLLQRLERELGGLAGTTVAVWGLAFKAGTDDVRSAASLDLVPRLLEAGARVQAYDPAAAEGFARVVPLEKHPGLTMAGDQWEALHGADALLILTEWEQFKASPLEVRRHLGGRVVVDSRNLLDPDHAASVGLIYRGTGRGRSSRR
ncbi:MAG TPA: UDP-glucose/GDP-mannose dehydrogenase family protein [Symbiobacteriaceae bacterium]|nr:UDP-glucose/GDP-mannose dehydrogenase family protein [Symbiobacteriaceae bacterium]